MKIKIDEQLKNADNKSLILNEGQPLTLKEVCINAILTPVQEEEEKKKFEKWEIFKKIRDAGEELSLTIEELMIVKKSIGKFYPPLIMGQCFEFLDK